MGHEKDMEEKRYRIIGTAGHIDHGKTWLVKALTGTDTDRLAEEKRRGITIENGFAFLKFPDGREAGIIDVPGHEKFIKNMLAGAGGMDIAMVVIAADEGVMPQTREHLAILSLLGIRKGVLVLTKGDLEWKKGLDQEIREFAEGTFLENEDVLWMGVGLRNCAGCFGNCAQPEKTRGIRSFPEKKMTAAQAEWLQKDLRFVCP